MDFTKILGDIKGKVLDAYHFEKLKHAYDLQEKNIKQLKESNELLQKKIYELETEKEHIQKANEEYHAQLEKFSLLDQEISEIADAILNLYVKTDETVLNLKKYYGVMPFTKIQVESGIDELCKKKILLPWTSIGDYGLTDNGKRYLTKKK